MFREISPITFGLPVAAFAAVTIGVAALKQPERSSQASIITANPPIVEMESVPMADNSTVIFLGGDRYETERRESANGCAVMNFYKIPKINMRAKIPTFTLKSSKCERIDLQDPEQWVPMADNSTVVFLGGDRYETERRESTNGCEVMNFYEIPKINMRVKIPNYTLKLPSCG